MSGLSRTAAADTGLPPVLARYEAAWNAADLDSILDCLHPHILYRDPVTLDLLLGRDRVAAYFEGVLRRFPRQHWTNIEVQPHREPGWFSASYDFQMTGPRWRWAGRGCELIVVDGDRIRLDDVYFQISDLSWRIPLIGHRINLVLF